MVACLLNVSTTCECISGTDRLGQLYVLPHSCRSYRSNLLSHPVTVHRAKSGNDPMTPASVATGVPVFESLLWLDRFKSPTGKAGIEPRSPAPGADTFHLIFEIDTGLFWSDAGEVKGKKGLPQLNQASQYSLSIVPTSPSYPCLKVKMWHDLLWTL